MSELRAFFIAQSITLERSWRSGLYDGKKLEHLTTAELKTGAEREWEEKESDDGFIRRWRRYYNRANAGKGAKERRRLLGWYKQSGKPVLDKLPPSRYPICETIDLVAGMTEEHVQWMLGFYGPHPSSVFYAKVPTEAEVERQRQERLRAGEIWLPVFDPLDRD